MALPAVLFQGRRGHRGRNVSASNWGRGLRCGNSQERVVIGWLDQPHWRIGLDGSSDAIEQSLGMSTDTDDRASIEKWWSALCFSAVADADETIRRTDVQFMLYTRINGWFSPSDTWYQRGGGVTAERARGTEREGGQISSDWSAGVERERERDLEGCGGGGLPDCISCYRIMSWGSHYHGFCFLLLCFVGLVIRGTGDDRWDR